MLAGFFETVSPHLLHVLSNWCQDASHPARRELQRLQGSKMVQVFRQSLTWSFIQFPMCEKDFQGACTELFRQFAHSTWNRTFEVETGQWPSWVQCWVLAKCQAADDGSRNWIGWIVSLLNSLCLCSCAGVCVILCLRMVVCLILFVEKCIIIESGFRTKMPTWPKWSHCSLRGPMRTNALWCFLWCFCVGTNCQNE